MQLAQTAIALNAAEVSHFSAIIDYIGGIHHHIDPDYYKIDLAALKALGVRLEKENPFMFDFESHFLLETAVMAADTYSTRSGYDAVANVEAQDFECLTRRMAEIHGAMLDKTGGRLKRK
jgi:uncharacterized protein with GYD domain